jgi:hypothetical protein
MSFYLVATGTYRQLPIGTLRNLLSNSSLLLLKLQGVLHDNQTHGHEVEADIPRTHNGLPTGV